MRFASLALLTVLTGVPAPLPGQAMTEGPEVQGQRLAEQAAGRLGGYGTLSARLTIVLRRNGGDERVRAVRLRSMETGNGGERTLVVFDEPRDVRGTALLTATRREGDDEQWLYLPALRRVKRIATGSGSFMGTEFAYEDIATQDPRKYHHRYRGDELLEGTTVAVVERFPVNPGSQYRRQVMWIDREHQVLRIDYYDRDDVLLKTLHFRGYRTHATRFPRADEMEMVNHRTGAVTVLRWSDYDFHSRLTERDFDPANLGGAP